MSTRPILFLLKPGFHNEGKGPYFCPDSALVEGFLAYHASALPAGALDIQRIDFKKPRAPVVALLGEAAQSCPVLVLDGDDAPESAKRASSGKRYIDHPIEIARYLAGRYNLSQPH